MKRRFLFVWFLFLAMIASFVPDVARGSAQETATTTITVHYRRTDNNYTNWDFYTWNYEPGGGEAQAFNFSSSDSYGRVATIPLTGNYVGMTSMGFIVRKGGEAWLDKDIGTDRFIDIPATSPDGNFQFWLYQGLKSYFLSEEEALNDKIVTSIFSNMRVLKTKVMASSAVQKSQFHVYADGVEITDYSFSFSASTATVTFNDYLPVDRSYHVAIDFPTGRREMNATFSGIYDTQQFLNNYSYDGDDLGVTFDKSKGTTTFKLWAPLSSSVVLNIYNTGTPKRYGGSDTAVKKFYMTRGEKGVWSHTEPAIMHGCYYTYTVTNGASVNETIDPYAKGCGVNGLRGMVVDFDQINEAVQFKPGVRPNQIAKTTDAIVYEIHIRDMTIDETWGGNPDWAGKYLGLTQSGTKYTSGSTTVTTGLDHMKELGITHVQIMPTYDFETVDETSTGRNWGYDPLNYNCLEGSYSTDPYDGFQRIIEFKQMVKTLTEAGIAINMDVVYNHTARATNSNFDLIVPDYYHRMTEDGDFYNGSGCGNEMASQRPMVRKLILDSTKFWFSEYNLSGFRFDLMALIDTETMGQVYQQLEEEYPLVMVYGEPWDGDGSNGSGRGYTQTRINTLSTIEGVAIFNDQIRDSLKGSSEGLDGGYVQTAKTSSMNLQIVPGIEGKFNANYPNLEPGRMINYVACHDNLTLWDKISVSSSGATSAQRAEMNKQADSIVMFSQGIPFFQEGQEFLRTKPYIDASGRNVGGYDANSYRSSDAVNAMKYDFKVRNLSIFEYYKDIISFRKDHNLFRLGTRAEITDAIEFRSTGSVIGYVLSQTDQPNDTYGQIYVVTNAGARTTYTLNYRGSWAVALNKNGRVEIGSTVTSVTIDKNETIILVNKDRHNPDYQNPAYQGVGTIDWSFTAPPIGGGTNGEYNPNLVNESLINTPFTPIFNQQDMGIRTSIPTSFSVVALGLGLAVFLYISTRKRG